MAKKENSALDQQLKDTLNDAGFQRGLAWRSEKVKAVALARKRGIPDKEIFRQLKIAGLMDTTAKKIMQDAYYFDGENLTELNNEELQQELDEENQNRIALGKSPISLEQWKKIR
jgi:hypothetical protein